MGNDVAAVVTAWVTAGFTAGAILMVVFVELVVEAVVLLVCVVVVLVLVVKLVVVLELIVIVVVVVVVMLVVVVAVPVMVVYKVGEFSQLVFCRLAGLSKLHMDHGHPLVLKCRSTKGARAAGWKPLQRAHELSRVDPVSEVEPAMPHCMACMVSMLPPQACTPKKLALAWEALPAR
mmetsp:Transcript_57055/g.113439  ORF Transcript_57055/g.113439 Transcript_57055/m.113439 type:complete len:177 (-) Transcript_57055:391-921(-)